MADVSVLMPCAGLGKRMGGRVNKPYIEVLGRPLLAYTLDIFQKHTSVAEIVLIARQDEVDFCRQEIVKRYGFTKVREVVAGGEERQDSVFLGLAHVDEKSKWIAVHDGVRPLLTERTLDCALEAVRERGAAVVGVPVKDTIKEVNGDLLIRGTPDRSRLWQVQTPQIFLRNVLVQAYSKAAELGWRGTDDASLVERLGIDVYMVRGDYDNIKVTTPEDLVFFEEIVKKRTGG